MTKQYTGHHDIKMLDGKTLVEWLKQPIRDECRYYKVDMPTDRQIAVVVSTMRMHTLIMHAAEYDYSELHDRDQVTKYWPLQSSIGRYFRDAAQATLEEGTKE